MASRSSSAGDLAQLAERIAADLVRTLRPTPACNNSLENLPGPDRWDAPWAAKPAVGWS